MGLGHGGLDIFDVSAQTFVDNGESELVPRNVLKGHKFNLQAFSPRFKVQVLEMGSVDNIDLRHMGKAEYAKQAMYADVGMGLFHGFSRSCLFGAFPQFHEPGWEGPESDAGFDGAAAEEDFIFPFRDGPRHDFRVLVVNGLACPANGSQEGFTLGNFLLDLVAAFTAKIEGWEHVFYVFLGR